MEQIDLSHCCANEHMGLFAAKLHIVMRHCIKQSVKTIASDHINQMVLLTLSVCYRFSGGIQVLKDVIMRPPKVHQYLAPGFDGLLS